MKTITLWSVSILILFIFTINLNAQSPIIFTYQGKLSDNGMPLEGQHDMTFAIYNSESGGTALWSEQKSAVELSGGIFTVQLGESDALTTELFTQNSELYIGVTIDENSEMAPRFRLNSVAYSVSAAEAAAVSDNSISSQKITDAAVTNSKLANDAVTSDKIQDEAVSSSKLAENSITSDKIQNEAISASDLASSSISADKIADGAVTNSKIAGDAVTADKIADAQVVKDINVSTEGGSSLGQLKDAVTLRAGNKIQLAVDGNAVTISSTADDGGADGDITSVTAGQGLLGGDTKGEVTLALDTTFTDGRYVEENEANSISEQMIQDGAVSADKIQNEFITSLEEVFHKGGNIDLVGQGGITIEGNNAAKTITFTGPGDGNGAGVTSIIEGNGIEADKPTGDVTLSLNTSYTDNQYVNENQANSITKDMIQSNAVTTNKIGDSQVTAAKIGEDFISTINNISNKAGNIELYEGNNIDIQEDPGNNRIIINATTSGGGGDNDWTESGDDIYRTSGNVGIGTNSPNHKLDVWGVIRATRSDGDRYVELNSNEILFSRNSANRLRCTSVGGHLSFVTNGRKDDNNESNLVLWPNLNASFLGKVYINNGSDNPPRELTVNGDIQCNQLYEVSDARFKTDVTDLTGALDKVTELRGINYSWKKDEYKERSFSSEKQLGFIAQEVEEVVPEVVSTDSEGYKSIQYSKLIPLLVESIKELKAQNQKLEERLSELEK